MSKKCLVVVFMFAGGGNGGSEDNSDVDGSDDGAWNHTERNQMS